ncbi:MAG: septal ring lytic transglycosylase RlpA family protein [Alphaproteobacteria bacterium]|nr:septal ring lytic transglycosylase RlpA family protein [Alphaproteobacteria bacterium]
MRLFPVLGCFSAALLLLAACSETQLVFHTAKQIGRDGDSAKGTYKVGKPYKIDSVWYYPGADYSYRETGVASWYGPKFDGNKTANGERFDMNRISAAHRTLPLPSMVRVTNLENGRAIRVRVNDRGPFAHGRVIDLSRRAAQLLGFKDKGTAKVLVEILEEESRQLALLYSAGAGQRQIASVGGGHPAPNNDDKPPVKAAPRIGVTEAPLREPGTKSDPSAVTAPRPSKKEKMPLRVAVLEPASDGRVTQEPVRITRMYIQAGSFAQYVNAHRLKARLSVLGTSRVLAVMFKQQQMFRVRVGPIKDLKSADQMLGQIISAGYTDARLIVGH